MDARANLRSLSSFLPDTLSLAMLCVDLSGNVQRLLFLKRDREKAGFLFVTPRTWLTYTHF